MNRVILFGLKDCYEALIRTSLGKNNIQTPEDDELFIRIVQQLSSFFQLKKLGFSQPIEKIASLYLNYNEKIIRVITKIFFPIRNCKRFSYPFHQYGQNDFLLAINV